MILCLNASKLRMGAVYECSRLYQNARDSYMNASRLHKNAWASYMNTYRIGMREDRTWMHQYRIKMRENRNMNVYKSYQNARQSRMSASIFGVLVTILISPNSRKCIFVQKNAFSWLRLKSGKPRNRSFTKWTGHIENAGVFENRDILENIDKR